MSGLKNKVIGVAITGSFCTLTTTIEAIEMLVNEGASVYTILSQAVDSMDTKFGSADELKEQLTKVTGNRIITTIPSAEPIGPGRLLDAIVVLPATGNTIAKISAGIADSTTSFAVKSQLRNGGPIILGISSNDALAAGAKNIGKLLNTKNIYFIPFGQDDYVNKPTSIVFKKEYVVPAVCEALEGRQVQPLLV